MKSVASQTRPQKIVVAGICIQNEKVLLGRRRKDDGVFGGYWEFPGGKVEAGESDEVALKREFFEELNVELGEAKYFKTLHWNYPDKTLELRFYLVAIPAAQLSKIKLNVHDELEWVQIENVDRQSLMPANLEILENIKAHLS